MVSKRIITYIIPLFGTLFLLSSCSVSRHLPAGESLYVGAEVKINLDSLVSAKQAKAVKASLVPLIRPTPNSTLLGFPYKVWFYYFLGEPKKEKSPRAWFRKRFGEAPVLASRRTVTANSTVVTNYLNNEGYFRSITTGELIEKERAAKAVYTVNLQPRYRIKDVTFVKNDSSVFSAHFYNTQKNTLLKTGNPYQFSTIEAERERIERELKKRGFYYFRPDYLIIKADTNLNSQRVNLYVELKPNTTQLALKRYTINEIYVISENGLLKSDTLAGAIRKRGLNIVNPANDYRARVFADAIGFRSNMLYSNEIHDISLSRLINLKNFKFVKNRFELLPRSDSALLDVYYYLTPLKRKSLRAELSAVTKSNNLAGSQLNLTWQNRNAFRGAELLRFSANAGIDLQLGGKKRSSNLRDYYRTSVEGELSFPRFVLPFYRMNPAKNQTLPRTALTAGYEQLSQKDFYTQTSIRLNWGYVWRRNTQVEHSFTPIALNIVRPRNISEALVDSISSPFLQIQDLLRYFNILENRLILGAQYTINYTPTPAPESKHRFVLNAGVDIAGNTAGLFAKKEDGVGIVLGIPYEQYARFDTDFRYYNDISPSIRWANRFIAGIGVPYGNSFSLPQFKQYFAGGSNGIRAFRGRALGPGSVKPDPASLFGFASFGDIRLEFNTELRFKINSYFETALFTDAGNVWMYRNFENSFYLAEDNAVFTNQFYKQIAVGSGLGLRLTLPFVLLRFDLATPLRKPWLSENERWVLNQFDFRNKSWRQENLVLNIAVGYSF